MSKSLKAKQDFWQVDKTRESPPGGADRCKLQGARRNFTYSKTGGHLHQCSVVRGSGSD